MEIKPEEYKDYLKEDFLNVHEAAALLDITEEELWDHVHKHQVPTHALAGAFLRFKKEDIEQLKNRWRIERELFPKRQEHFAHDSSALKPPGILEKAADFWYFNDFYVFCSLVVVALLYFIISSQ